MNLIKGLNDAVTYIENNLDQEIEYEKLSEISLISGYYFQKIFGVLSEVPLSEYIRMRRLTKAAEELCSTDEKVIDIALKYGYSSPTAFNRAFKALHGASPTEVRKSLAGINFYPPLTFQISIKGAVCMNYKIVEKESFRILGKSIVTTFENGNNFREIPEFWGRINSDTETCAALNQLSDEEGMYGVCLPGKNANEMIYVIGAKSQADKGGFEEFLIPASSWAVFECVGPMPKAIQELTQNIYQQWLPSSEYASRIKSMDIEYYTLGDTTAPNYKSEIWLAIEDK